ncbi:ABC-F family ATP-binding cassette domain-containing protein [Rhodovulum sp. DZ06]|uniref:ABC-F family ATP-binding cassette domain-containing protein n=1 Tax=Rhodovulum sp. DZ06 TaxID=3425126 RepID=UPI003D32D475
MLQIRDLSFTLAGRPLLQGASATVPANKTVGVVGRNGTGKTTLFKLIRGDFALDSGEIEIPRGWRIGGVAQEVPAGPDPLIEIVLRADAERAALLAEAETAEDPHRIAEIQLRLADIDAHSAEARAAAILSGLGFDSAAQARPAAEYSGGWRMRVALAAVLFSRPDLLLLDEPTNYLDLEGAVWLETFLASRPATTLVISHDRGLLNRAVDGILHLENKDLTYYGVPYDRFVEERRAKIEQTNAAAAKRQAERAHIQSFVDRFRAKASKARQAQARLKMLERMQPIDSVVETGVAGFRFPNPAPLSPPLMVFDKAAVGYDGVPILKNLSLRIDQEDRIALLGANGQGKSTLSKLIAGRLSAMDGAFRHSGKMKVGYFAQHQLDELVAGETPIQHFQRLFPEDAPAKIRSRLAQAGLGEAIADIKVSSLSGGQKARLCMAICAAGAPHALVLDEPTNHLDIESRDALAQALAAYEGAVILVSHDPHLVESVADRLWLVEDGGVSDFDGDMEDYRKLLLSRRGGGGRAAEARVDGAAAGAQGPGKAAARRSAAETRKALAGLKAEVDKCEARVSKLMEMQEKIDERLADPALYESGDGAKIEALQAKRGEIVDGLERAESLWMDAQERLEAAEAERAAG